MKSATNVEPQPGRLRRLAGQLGHRRAVVLIILIAGVLVLPTLGVSPALDDLLLHEQYQRGGVSELYRFVTGDPATTAARRAAGELVWWTADTLQVDFWRPLSALAFALDELAPWARGLQSIVWYLLAV